MSFPLHPFAVLSLLSAMITLLAVIPAWKRTVTGSLSLGLLMLSMVVWSGFYSARWMNLPLEEEILWINLMYIGITALPTLFLVFGLEFTRASRWLAPRWLLLLSIMPLVSLVCLWTNGYHHLFYLSIQRVQENDNLTTIFVRGPWYYINTVYSYAMIGLGFLILIRSALRSGPLYRQQYRLIFLGSIIPWVGNIYSEFYYEALNGLDLAPITFGVSGIIYAFAIQRTHFMNLIPVARSYLIENMQDGILVLDTQNRILDINPAIQQFLGDQPSSYMGKNVSDALQGWVKQPDSLWNQRETRTELQFPIDPSRFLELQVTALYDKNHLLNGHLMVFHEITESKRVEQRLREANDRLQVQLIEIGLLQSKLREQAIRDPLTDLFNRRYLEETLDRELARAAREHYHVSIIMMDLDHFKRINDTYGHEAGDHVLRAVASIIAEHSRRGDFACRYGGEEFVIVMPNNPPPAAYERAKRLRRLLNSLALAYQDHTLHVTVSTGIACYPRDGEIREVLLRAADQALYAAKRAGRDHILSYDQLRLSE